MILAGADELDGDDEADEGDDAFPLGPVFMWLIYKACSTCGAAEQQPCVGPGPWPRFGPHEGRLARWERDPE